MVVTHSTGFITLPSLAQQKKQVTLTAMVVDNSGGNPSEDQRARLFQPAFQELKARHPDMDINMNYVQSPYNQTRTHISNSLGNQTPVDMISLDQVWFGEFAQKGYLTDKQTVCKAGEEYLIGNRQTLRVLCIMARYMPFGPGLM